MNPKIASKKTQVVVLVALTLFALTATPVLAWWSGWYTPSFVGSYSPSSYNHGQWNSSKYGGTEGFGSKMKWNQTRADGVRNYSNHRHWISWCGWCYAYYTHDHCDMSDKLNGWGMSTNMPDPKFDWDDDDGNGWDEESEVVSVNKSFPATEPTEYNFRTYYKRQVSGSGSLYETPAVSAKPAWSSEYQTWHYDNHETLDYYTYGYYTSGPQRDEPGEAPVGTPYSTTLSIDQFPVHIWGIEGAPTMNVGLGYSLQDSDELTAYADWARTHPGSELCKAGVKQALTVITFNQPVLPKVLSRLLSQANESSVEIVKAVYLDASDPDFATNVWTLQTKVDSDYVKELDGLAADIAANDFDDDEERPHLEMQGIVAITVWLPLDTVDFLNSHRLVYLADASPSYLRLVASETKEAEQAQTSVEQVELLRDGFASFIRPSFNDVYPELQAFSIDKK